MVNDGFFLSGWRKGKTQTRLKSFYIQPALFTDTTSAPTPSCPIKTQWPDPPAICGLAIPRFQANSTNPHIISKNCDVSLNNCYKKLPYLICLIPLFANSYPITILSCRKYCNSKPLFSLMWSQVLQMCYWLTLQRHVSTLQSSCCNFHSSQAAVIQHNMLIHNRAASFSLLVVLFGGSHQTVIDEITSSFKQLF